MEKETLFSKFLRYTSLNILGMLGTSLYVVADAFFIAFFVGAKGLIAVNLTLPMFNLMTAFALAIGVGGASRFAMHKSLDREEDAYRVFSAAIKINFSGAESECHEPSIILNSSSPVRTIASRSPPIKV